MRMEATTATAPAAATDAGCSLTITGTAAIAVSRDATAAASRSSNDLRYSAWQRMRQRRAQRMVARATTPTLLLGIPSAWLSRRSHVEVESGEDAGENE